jgi:hypothetical protein
MYIADVGAIHVGDSTLRESPLRSCPLNNMHKFSSGPEGRTDGPPRKVSTITPGTARALLATREKYIPSPRNIRGLLYLLLSPFYIF